MPPIVSLVGKPGCGKTTLLEKLIPALGRQGYRTGTIKHHVHAFEMDTPGKDTWRHKQAGAHAVALSSPTGVGVIRSTDHDTAVCELAARYFFDVDLVITEGYKRAGFPKIEVFRSTAHQEPLAERDNTWAAMVSDVRCDPALPCFSPADVDGIAAFLITRFITPAAGQKVSLLVNGADIPLNDFVANFIRQTVLGMTSTLKGCQAPKEIILSLRNE